MPYTAVDELENRLRFMATMTDEPESTLFPRLINIAVEMGEMWPFVAEKLATRVGVTL